MSVIKCYIRNITFVRDVMVLEDSDPFHRRFRVGTRGELFRAQIRFHGIFTKGSIKGIIKGRISYLNGLRGNDRIDGTDIPLGARHNYERFRI